MSELIQKHDNRATIRWKLLTGASALALTAYVASADAATAGDADHPLVWLELNGQLSRLQDSQEIYAPPFVALTPPIFSPPQKAERPPLYSVDGGAALSLQPEDSSWIFSASIRYGRTGSDKHTHHQTYSSKLLKYATGLGYTSAIPIYPIAARFTDVRAKQTESHTIVDFQAGRDLGLGMFGMKGSSSLNAGIRIAQFRSKSQITLNEDPDWRFVVHDYNTTFYGYPLHYQRVIQPYHSFAGTFRADRSFHGIGPSLSWNSSVPFAGNPQDGELDVDWSLNGAVLFGRQSTKTSHQSSEQYGRGFANNPVRTYHATLYQNGPYPHTRSRNVTVPNVGGSVGLSWQLQNFKASFGYKADFFFGAIDGGIDARKNENRAFYGPYASISIGLGD